MNYLSRIVDVSLGLISISFSVIAIYLKGPQWYHWITIPAGLILIARGLSLKVQTIKYRKVVK